MRSNKTLKIKIEVDRQPPINFKTEEKLLLRPFSCYVKFFDKQRLFSETCKHYLFGNGKTESKKGIGMTWNGKLKRDSVGCNSFFNKNKRYQILARR